MKRGLVLGLLIVVVLATAASAIRREDPSDVECYDKNLELQDLDTSFIQFVESENVDVSLLETASGTGAAAASGSESASGSSSASASEEKKPVPKKAPKREKEPKLPRFSLRPLLKPVRLTEAYYTLEKQENGIFNNTLKSFKSAMAELKNTVKQLKENHASSVKAAHKFVDDVKKTEKTQKNKLAYAADFSQAKKSETQAISEADVTLVTALSNTVVMEKKQRLTLAIARQKRVVEINKKARDDFKAALAASLKDIDAKVNDRVALLNQWAAKAPAKRQAARKSKIVRLSKKWRGKIQLWKARQVNAEAMRNCGRLEAAMRMAHGVAVAKYWLAEAEKVQKNEEELATIKKELAQFEFSFWGSNANYLRSLSTETVAAKKVKLYANIKSLKTRFTNQKKAVGAKIHKEEKKAKRGKAQRRKKFKRFQEAFKKKLEHAHDLCLKRVRQHRDSKICVAAALLSSEALYRGLN